MVQNPKGGGLSSSFGGGGTSTWVLSTALLVLILLASTTLIQGKAESSIDVTDQTSTESLLNTPEPETNTTEDISTDNE